MTTPTSSPDWRERAVSRSLVRARGQAEERLQRLLASAKEIMGEGVAEVTVNEVVNRSGQSLRTFYQHFASKNELMLALLEDGCEELAAEMEKRAARAADAQSALRAAIKVLQRAGSVDNRARRLALDQFSGSLLHTDPASYQRTQDPLLRVLVPRVAAVVPGSPDPHRAASLVLNLIQGASRRNGLLLSQGLKPMTDEEMWACVRGLLALPGAG